jgi:dihydroorotate dehydrogenase
VYTLLRPALFRLEPERAHEQAMRLLELGYRTRMGRLIWPRPKPLLTRAFGLEFDNPVGLAAGLDKNGEHIDALFALGFGFVEIGTVTPRPQPGNPAPRLFRLSERSALINRMGFNNDGVDALVRNVERSKRCGILGINIGKNKDTPNERAADDYKLCMERVYGLADYLVVNISSPNTAGLRDLQGEHALRRLLGSLREHQERLSAIHGRRVPMLVKLAPDLSDTEIDASAAVINEAHMDGVIATNTTLDRVMVKGDPLAGETGGLSGQPLYGRATAVLRRLRSRLDERIALIGVGGIMSGADAAAKVAAGATLIQLYTGLIYQGPALIRETVDAIRRRRESPSR